MPATICWLRLREWEFIAIPSSPHQALAGQTPAERAGIGVEGQDKWLALLTGALRRKEMPAN